MRTALAAVTAAVVAGGTFGVAATATPAAAAPTAPQGTVTRFERSSLRPAAAVKGKLRTKMDAVRGDLIDLSARHGRSVDSRAVSVFTDPNSTVVVAVGNDSVVDRVNVGDVDGVVRGLGVVTHEADPGAVASTPVVGFAGEPSATGYQMIRSGAHVVTTADDPDVQPTPHYKNVIKSWYWKYHLPEGSESAAYSASNRAGADFWVYARRGDADAGGSGSATYSSVMDDLTIRARPWGGAAGDFKQLIAKAPTATSSSCTSSGTLEFAAGPFSVEIPQNNCSNVSGVTSTGSPYEFGSDWNGSSQGPVSIEAIAGYKVAQNKEPKFADYIWANFWTVTAGYPHTPVKWTDTGW